MSAQPLAVPMQAPRSKPAPTASPVFGDSGGRGGVNVHTYREHLGKQSPKVYVGSTVEWLERLRTLKNIETFFALENSLRKLGREDDAKALMCCGRWFKAKKVTEGIGLCQEGKVFLHPLHCDLSLCQVCARRRAIPYQDKIWDIIEKDKANLFFMTFTLKTVAELSRADIDRMVHAFNELRKKENWSEMIGGGFYSVETTYHTGWRDCPTCAWRRAKGDMKFCTRGWHLHMHALVKAVCPTTRDWLSWVKAEWRFLTEDSDYVYIERAYGLDKKGKKTRRVNRRAVNELVKYSTKSASFAALPERVGEFLDAFKNVRRMQAFGCFYGAQKEAEKQSEEPEAKKLLPGCVCGGCTYGQLHLFATVHMVDTRLMPDGARVLSPEYLARAGLDENYLLDSVPDDPRKVEADTRAMQSLLFRQSAAQVA